jgi:acetate kinase
VGETLENFSLENAISYFLGTVLKQKNITVEAISFRIVAPHDYFLDHRHIDSLFIEKLEEVSPLDPLHTHSLLHEIRLVKEHFPTIPLFGISDTAFHKTISPINFLYALPKKYHARKYGYHGLSVEYVQSLLERNISYTEDEKYIILHLGSGSSVSGLYKGESVYNSFGMTPASGIPSSTRVGDIDALCALSLLPEGNTLSAFLYGGGGIKAMSSYDEEGSTGTNDVRELLSRLESLKEEEKKAAEEAVSYYVNRVVQEIGKAYFILGGVSKIVFTGTIGFRSEKMRSFIKDKISFLGLQENQYKVLEADEEYQIVKNTIHFL